MQLDVEIDFSIGARDYCGASEVQLDVAISFLDYRQGLTPPVMHDASDLTRRFELCHMSERGLVSVAANQNSGLCWLRHSFRSRPPICLRVLGYWESVSWMSPFFCTDVCVIFSGLYDVSAIERVLGSRQRSRGFLGWWLDEVRAGVAVLETRHFADGLRRI